MPLNSVFFLRSPFFLFDNLGKRKIWRPVCFFYHRLAFNDDRWLLSPLCALWDISLSPDLSDSFSYLLFTSIDSETREKHRQFNKDEYFNVTMFTQLNRCDTIISTIFIEFVCLFSTSLRAMTDSFAFILMRSLKSTVKTDHYPLSIYRIGYYLFDRGEHRGQERKIDKNKKSMLHWSQNWRSLTYFQCTARKTSEIKRKKSERETERERERKRKNTTRNYWL